MASQLPAAGWYTDPLGDPGRIRYWSGREWTDQYRPAPVVTPAKPRPARDLNGLGMLAAAGLALVALGALISVLADLNYRTATDEVLNGLLAPPFTRVQGALDRVHEARRIKLVTFVIAAIAFLPWFYRAYANLPALGVSRLRHPTGWAVGAWFVPFLNLIRPKQIADDVYRGSRPEARAGGDPASIPAPALLHWWWAMFLLSGLGNAIGVSMVNSANDGVQATPEAVRQAIEQEQTGFLVSAVAGCSGIVSAVLAVIFVLRVTGMQRDAREQGPALAYAPAVTPVPARPTTPSVPSAPEGSQSPPGSSNPW
jgi:hypothetical protein